MQLTQLAAPVLLWNVPEEQVVQSAAPVAEYNPAAQETHWNIPVFISYIPPAQLEQLLEPTAEYRPVAQLKHETDETTPVADE